MEPSVHAYVLATAVLACCWLPVTIQMAECPIQGGDRCTLCAKCSDHYATVRWNCTNDRSGELIITYNCEDSAGQAVDFSDSCLGGDELASVSPISVPHLPSDSSHSSRVHAIDIALTNGTLCNFMSTLDSVFGEEHAVSCQIKDTAECEEDPEGCAIPVTCARESDENCNCACNAGFEMGQCDSTSDCKGGGVQCLDIDDCENNSTNDCHDNAVCTDKYGGFQCNCSEGFEGNGFSCTLPVRTSTVAQQMTSSDTPSFHITPSFQGTTSTGTIPPVSTTSASPDQSPIDTTNLEPIVSGLVAVSLVVVAGLCIGGAILTIVLKDRRRSKRKASEINETLKTLRIKNVVDLSFAPVDSEKFDIPPESPVTVIHELELVDPELLSRHPNCFVWLGGHDNHSGIGDALSTLNLGVQPYCLPEEQQEATPRNDISNLKEYVEEDEAWAATTPYEEPSTAITPPTMCDGDQVLERMPVSLFSDTNKEATEYLPNDQSVELTMGNCKPYVAATPGKSSTRTPVDQEQALEILFTSAAMEEEDTEPVMNDSAVEVDYYGTRTLQRIGSSGYVENNLS